MTSVRTPSFFSGKTSDFYRNQQSQSNQGIRSAADNYVQNSAQDKSAMRTLLKDLNKPETGSGAYDFNKKFTATSQNKVNGFLQLAGAKIDKELEKAKAPTNYKYKKVSSQILAAKNSVSAGKALLAAKRGVMEIKGKLSSGKGDSEELMIALSHAKRMEMAARKKKHHLELEEMVEKTQARDEKIDKMKETADALQDAASYEVEAAEEELLLQEDAIFEQREEMMSEAVDEMELSGEELSEDAMAELNMMIAEFGEEELEQLEEQMEMLENMEIVDPHMSEDALKRLKTRHRASEFKQVAKADMEYVKSMIKHITERGAPAMAAPAAMPQVSQVPASAAVSIDVSV